MNYKPAEFERSLARLKANIKCVILFGTNEGEMATLAQKCVAAVCGAADDAFNFAALEGDKIAKDGQEVYAEFHAQSLMGGRRAVWVKNADNNLAAPLKEMLPDTKSENLLILTSNSLNTKSSLITWAKDREDVAIVGCYEEREENMATAVAALLQAKGLQADMATMQLLCARLSPDRKLNEGEIDKLATYLGERTQITPADVTAAVSDAAGANVEDLCFYTAGGEVRKASAMFKRLLGEGEDAATLVRQISYHFGRLLECAAKTEKGASAAEAAKSLRPPLKFYREREFMRQLQIWQRERLLGALKMLYDCERDCKTTGMPAEECAGYTILRIAGAADKLAARR